MARPIVVSGVDKPRDDFLAGARLALQARRRVGGGHLRRTLDHVEPRVRYADGSAKRPVIVSQRVETATRRFCGHHRRRPSCVMSRITEIDGCMWNVHWPTSRAFGVTFPRIEVAPGLFR